MKIVLFSLFGVILIGITSYSYAQVIVPEEDTELPKVMLQLELRDSNGILVAYVEAEQIIGIRPLDLTRFLDNLNQSRKEFFIKDDKKYEIHQWEKANETYNEKLALSTTGLLDIYQNEFVKLVDVRHDSFQAQPGDTLRIWWTIIRPAS